MPLQTRRSATNEYDNRIGGPSPENAQTIGRILAAVQKQKVALVAFVFIIALVLAAILAPVLAPYDPSTPDYNAVLRARVPGIGRERMPMGVTYSAALSGVRAFRSRWAFCR